MSIELKEEADEFYLHNNNKRFNSIEESLCHLAFVERIEVVKSSKVTPFRIQHSFWDFYNNDSIECREPRCPYRDSPSCQRVTFAWNEW